MSIHQLDKVLEGSLREKGVVDDGKKILLFVYDRHYIWKGFENDYPSANFLGVGWLNGWDWHMQRSGKPNIRPMYEHEAGFVREKLGERGTLGYIFTIAPDDVELFRRSYRGVRIRLEAKVDMASPVWKPQHQVEVVTFWDPYDTISNTNIIWDFKESAESLKWTEGLRNLQSVGCPGWYMQKVIDYIRGMDPVPTTVGGIYVKPEQRRVGERLLVQKSPFEEMLMMKPQEGVAQSNTIGNSAGNLKVLNGARGKDSRVTKAPNMNTIKRPQPVNVPAFKAAQAEAKKKKEVNGGTETS